MYSDDLRSQMEAHFKRGKYNKIIVEIYVKNTEKHTYFFLKHEKIKD